jgi:DNA invertase Pin-like site-specific DNA recombinase
VSTVSKPGPRDYMGYIRVSQVRGRDSEENRERFHSPDTQLDRIRESVERVEGTLVGYRYDPDKSGYQKDVVRDGWNESVAWVMESPTTRGIVAYDTSRLSRNLWKLLGDVQHTIVPAGGRVVVAGESIDTVQPNWQMQLQMAGMIAEQFSIKVGERWREVHQRRLRRKQSPVGKVPYGYRRVEGGDGGIEPDPETAPVLRRMYALYLDGNGLRGVCQILNGDGVPAPKGGQWSTTSLSRILRNPACVGRFVFEGAEHEGGWEPVVDAETWEAFQRAQARRAAAPTPSRARAEGWVLAGIAKCALCGRNMTVNYLPQEAEPEDLDVQVPVPSALAKRRGLTPGATWSRAEDKHEKNAVSTAMCTTYRSKGKQACPGVFVRRLALETQFTYFLATLQGEVASAATGRAARSRESARREAEARAAAARDALERASETRVNLGLLRAKRDLDEAEYRAALRVVEAEAAEAREALAEAEGQAEAAEPLGEVWDAVASGGEGMTRAEWRHVLKKVVTRVEVSDDALLFVPSVGEPVEWKRQGLPRGRAKRRAGLADSGGEAVRKPS